MQLSHKPSPAFTKGRGGKKITTIVIHHWDDPAKNPTFEGTVSYLTRNRAKTSAHWVVEAGRACQLVDEADTAWHAGNWEVNQASIGIECNPRASEADKQTIGDLIGQIQNRWGTLKIIGHKDVHSTECPGRYHPPAKVLAPYTTSRAASAGTSSTASGGVASTGRIDELAHLVIAGKYGNGDERRTRLGAQYAAVQARVNQILTGSPS